MPQKPKPVRTSKKRRQGLLLERLEDRLVFDAAPMPVPVDAEAPASDAGASAAAVQVATPVTDDVPSAGWQEGPSATAQAAPAPSAVSRPNDAPASPTASAAEAPAVEILRRELLVIDGSIPDASALATSLRASAPSNVDLRIELLDPTQDELAEIGEILAAWSAEGGAIDAIHLVGHAGAGQLTLGSTSIYGNSLTPESAAFASLASWNAHLSEGADLLLYGCDLAAGASGLALMQNLSAATGADVAASTDPTGSSAAGGNWILESTTGAIEAATLSSTLNILLPSSPSTSIDAPDTVYLGESFDVTIAFDNISPTDVGYGPFMDIAIDTTGGDEDGDGLTVTTDPTYLGQPLTFTTIIFNDADNGGLGVLHPYAVGLGGTPVYVLSSNFGPTFQNGDTLLVVQLPFGSFTPNQPVVDVVLGLGVSGNANIDHPLVIASRGGFQYGDDPLSNPTTDPSILGPVTTTQVDLVVLDLTKTYVGPEDETATGPNYTRRYRLSLNVADGQTLTDVHIRDLLPDTMQYVGIFASSGLDSATEPSTTTPGGVLDVVFNSVTGGPGLEDAWVEFEFYVPRVAGNATAVLNPSGQNQRPLENQANVTATFDPLDPDDPLAPVADESEADNTTPDTDPEHTLEADSLAVQKDFIIISDTGATGPTPGDVLEYTIDFEVSDYYAFDNIVLSDLISDGQRFNAGFTPTLTINGNTYVLTSSGMNTANWEVQQNFTGAVASGNFTLDPAANDGTTRVVFNVSNELILRSSTITPATAEQIADRDFAAAGKLLGGGVRPTDPDPSIPNALGTYNAGATTGRITYRVTLQDAFTDAQNQPGQSGEAAVNPRDVLTNDVVIQGRTLDLAAAGNNLPGTGATVTEDSHNEVVIQPGELQKTIYAINGVINPTPPLSIQQGDTVTYRITYTIPTGDVENLRLRDFLPLPIFQADDPDLDGIEGALIFDTSGAGVPAVGFFKYGPDDSLGTAIGIGFQPTATFNVANGSNTVVFTYGTYSNPINTEQTADILFTVRVSDAPFADSLFLTNLAQSAENSTQQPTVEVNDNQIVQVILNEPSIGNINKGVVGYESTSIALGDPGDFLVFSPPSVPPGINRIPTSDDLEALRDSDLTGVVDAGDIVRFALGIENQGRVDAYDVMLSDTLRPSYVAPTSAATFASDVNLSVFFGNGVQLTDGQLVDSVVLVATTGDLAGFTTGTISGSPRIVDGQILELNDRVLVKDQSVAAENGVYRVSALTELDGELTAGALGGTNSIDVDFSLVDVTQGTQVRVNGVIYTVASTAGQTITLSSSLVDDVALGDAVTLFQATLTRAVDFNTAGEFVPNQHIAVLGGTASGNKSFQLTSTVTTLNTDAITYTQSPLAGPDYFYTYDPTTRAFSVLLADGAGIQNGGLNRGRDQNGIATTDGSNILFVTYDLTLSSDANASSSIVNTASLTNYASVDGGTDFTTENPTDTATVTVRDPQFTKELTSTEFSETGNNAGNQAVIGEEATYTLRITIPEGRTLNAQIVDLLDPGMQFVAIDTVSVSSGLTVPGTPGTGPTPANVIVGTNGTSLTFNLGDIVNSNTVNATSESIVVVYRVVVLNTNTPAPGNPAGNQATRQLVNQAELNYSWVDDPADDTQNGTLTDDPANNVVTVVEPTLLVDKQASANNITYSDTLSGVDADDVVFYRIRITNPAAGPSAYDITLSDQIPAFLTGVSVVSVNVTTASGGVGGSTTVNGTPGSPGIGDFDITTNLLTIDPSVNIDLGPNTRLEIIVSGTLLTSVAPDQPIDNTAAVTWSSLDGTAANDRDGSDGPGADGSVLNNYVASDSTRVRIDVPVLDKQVINTSESFTPGTISGTLQGRTVAVGEIVRYRLVVSVPEGTSRDLQLVDRLPTGMAFINDGTAMVAFVSQGAGQLTSNTITDGAAYFTGVAVGTVTPTFSLIDGEVSSDRTADVDAYNSGTDVIFKLGNVTNTNTDDTNDEYIVIEFNALVLNTAGTGNQSGTALNNDFQYRLEGSTANTQVGATSVQDSDNRVVVAESNLTVAKTASTAGPVDAGDTFSYTITIQNNATGDGATPAFDIRVRDLVDQIVTGTNPTAELEFLSYSVTAPANATILNDASSTVTDTLDLTFARLDAGSTITITVNVQVRTGSLAGAEIENHVAVDYSSLPGSSGTETDTIGTTYGTTNVDLNPGIDSVLANASDLTNNSAVLGASASERTGANVPNPTNNGAPADNTIRNNYAVAANSPAGLTVQIPSIDKTFQNGSLTADDTSLASSTGSSVVIGESIIYDILVTLPEGVTSNLRVEDLVPAGLRIDSIQILVDGSSSMSTTPFTGTFGTTPTLGAPLNGASTLTLDFGNVDVPDDNIAENNSFVIRVVATVTNISANQQTLTRTNTARLLFNDPDGPANAGPAADRTISDANAGNDPLVTIVEPTLAVAKTGTSATPFDAAATVNYAIALTNTSGQTAYDITLLDNIDSNLVVTAGVLPDGNITTTGTATVSSGAFEIFEVSPGVFVLRTTVGADIDIPTGSSITINYDAVIRSDVIPGATVNNVANVRWTSLDGADADERTGEGIPNPAPETLDQNSTAGPVDNYAISDSTSFTVGSIQATKTLTDTSLGDAASATIGEVLTYRITVTLPEGLTPDFQIRDVLPAGVAYIPNSVTLETTGFVGSVSAPAVSPVAGTVFDNGTDILFDFSPITVTANNITTDNTFSFTYQAVVLDVGTNNGLGATPTTLVNTATHNNGSGSTFNNSAGSDSVVVEEPLLTIDKAVSTPTGDSGDPLTYTLTIAHDPTSNSTAYDLDIADILPDEFAATGFTAFIGVTDVSSSFLLSGQSFTTIGTVNLATTESLIITFTGTIDADANPSETVPNTANLEYSSYPLDRSETGGFNPNPDVTTDHERTRTASDSVNFTVPGATFSKSLFSTSETATSNPNVAIGETITYALLVTLPEGTTPDLSILDQLPPGLAYLSHTIVTTAVGSGSLLAADFAGTVPTPVRSGSTGDGDDQTFTFTAITVSGDNNVNNNRFLLLVTAQVLDVPGNSNGDVLTNTAVFDISTDGQPPSTPPGVNTTVVEPLLQVVKSHDDTDRSVTPGQTINYTLVISHQTGSTATAFDVALTDPIPAGLTLVPLTLVASSGTVSESGGVLSFSIDDLPVGSTVTITYSVIVDLGIAPNTNLDNNARLYWDGLEANDDNTVNPNDPTIPADGGDRDYGPGVDVEAPNPDPDTDPAQDTERVTIGTASVSNFVWNDLDGDGAQDLLEPGIGGVRVWVDLNADGIYDATEPSDITDANGQYFIGSLAAGTYTVRVDASTLPNDVTGTATFDDPGVAGTPPVTGNMAIVQLSAGENEDEVDFGYVGSASIGDLVWLNFNGNTVQDGLEPGIGNVTVNLYRDLNGDGDLTDPGDGLIATTTTGNTLADLGNYQFSGLIGGNYVVIVDTSSPALAGAASNYDLNDGTVGPDASSGVFPLGSDEDKDDVDFGFVGNAAIGDRIWYDLNGDGLQTVGEPGVIGVTVNLYKDFNGDGLLDAGDLLIGTTTTVADGIYGFSGLIGDNYLVEVVDGPGTPLESASNTFDKDDIGAGNNDSVGSVILSAGETDNAVDFGYQGPYSISGTVYHDRDKDSSIDPTDTGIGGTTLELYLDTNNDGAIDAGDLLFSTVITAANGTYSFSGLLTGNYLVRETQPIGYGNSETPTNLIDVTIEVTDITDQDFGETTGSLAGVVYRDDDNDGAQDPGEPGIANVDVTLEWSGLDGIFGNGDDQTVTIQTDVNGAYLFDTFNTPGFAANGDSTTGLLSAGLYRILETQPAGYVDGAETAGDASVNAGGVGAQSGRFGPDQIGTTDGTTDDYIQIGAGQDAVGYLFGELQPNLSVTKDDTLTEAAPGDTLTYTITVTNETFQQMSGVTVVDTLPDDILEFVTATGAPFTELNGVITFNVGDMAANEVIILTVTAQVRAIVPAGATEFTNLVTVTDDGTNGPDLDPTDNSFTDTDELPAVPDLTIFKTDYQTTVTPNQIFSYDVIVQNVGNQGATGVVVIDTLPPGLIFIAASDGGVYDALTGEVTFPTFILPTNESRIFTITVQVPFDARTPFTTYTNYATVTDDGTNGPDPTPENNETQDTDTLFFFGFDFFNNLSLIPDDDEDDFFDPPVYEKYNLPIDPMFTGITDPGTTLYGVIYDERGLVLGTQTVVADAAGNWSMTFPGAVINKQPHRMEVQQTLASYNHSDQSGYNLRRFFHPTVHSTLFFSKNDTPESVMRAAPSKVLQSMSMNNARPLTSEWSLHSYEFQMSSVNPADR